VTIISERIIRNGNSPKPLPAHKAAPEPLPAPEVPRLVSSARRAAVAITGAITAASFVLSFAGLFDLAERSGITWWLAWLWPLTVDGTIVMATLVIVALAPYASQAAHRQFFWRVGFAAAVVSVGGNILHKLIDGPVPPLLAAVVAAIAPLALLATTHGLAILVRFNPENERGGT
jgi:hypothetical protein